MPEFEIKDSQLARVVYYHHVEADSEDEALQKFHDGDYEFVESEIEDSFESLETTVTEMKE